MADGTAGPGGLVVDLLPIPVDRSGRRAIWRAYRAALLRDPCAYCGAPADVRDHIRSRRDGGSSTWINLTASCNRCNYSKAHRSLLGMLGAMRHRDNWNELERRLREQRAGWYALGRGAAA